MKNIIKCKMQNIKQIKCKISPRLVKERWGKYFSKPAVNQCLNVREQFCYNRGKVYEISLKLWPKDLSEVKR